MFGYAQEQEEIINEAEKATAEDVKKAAELIFDFDKVSIAACGNLENLDLNRLKDVLKE